MTPPSPKQLLLHSLGEVCVPSLKHAARHLRVDIKWTRLLLGADQQKQQGLAAALAAAALAAAVAAKAAVLMYRVNA